MQGGSRPRSTPAGAFLVGVVLVVAALCSFPDRPTGPCGDLDCSWQFGLHYQAQHYWSGFPVTQFTYGPLGFLTTPHDFGGWTAPVNVVFRVLVQLGLGVEIYALARRQWRRHWGGAASAVLAVGLMFAAPPAPEALELLVVVAGLVVVTGSRPLPRSALLVVGAVSGVLALVKFTVGLEAVGISMVVASAHLPLRASLRAACRTALAAALGLIVAFVIVTAQPFRLLTWVRGSVSISAGYSAMADSGSRDFTAGVVGVVLLAGLLVAWQLRSNLRALLIAEGSLYGLAKEGLTRFDSAHYMIVVSAALFLAAVAFALCGRLTIIAWAAAVGLSLAMLLAPSYRPRLAEASPGSTARALTQTGGQRAALRAEYDIPSAMIATIGRSRVDIDPFYTAVVYAYELRWSPIDTWARYSAYTTYLDEGDAASVDGAGRPDYLLAGPKLTIDDRWVNAEAPAYKVAVLCHYDVVSTSRAWILLHAVANKCGTPRQLGTTVLEPGVIQHVPALPGPGVMVAHINVAAAPLSALLATVLKPHGQIDVQVDGQPRRLVVATARDGVVVRSPAAFETYLPSVDALASVQKRLTVHWVYVPFSVT